MKSYEEVCKENENLKATNQELLDQIHEMKAFNRELQEQIKQYNLSIDRALAIIERGPL